LLPRAPGSALGASPCRVRVHKPDPHRASPPWVQSKGELVLLTRGVSAGHGGGASHASATKRAGWTAAGTETDLSDS
jgi:hypothetical protein